MPDGVINNMEAAAALEPDAELMLRLKAGDAASFDLLLARYRGPVIHFLYRMVQNAAVAEELAQEVFLRVYRARIVRRLGQVHHMAVPHRPAPGAEQPPGRAGPKG